MLRVRGRSARGAKRLTQREIECLGLCGQGRTNVEIGRALGLSARTVEHYLSSAMVKLGAQNRTAAVYHAAKLEII